MYLLSYRSKTNFVQISEGCLGFQSGNGIISIHFKGSGCQESEGLRVKILVKSEVVVASAQTWLCSVSQSCPNLCDPMGCSLQRPLPWDFPGKDTGVGRHFLLQEFFLTQSSNPHLLHWQGNSLSLRHLGSPSSARAVPERAICQLVHQWLRRLCKGPPMWIYNDHSSDHSTSLLPTKTQLRYYPFITYFPSEGCSSQMYDFICI